MLDTVQAPPSRAARTGLTWGVLFSNSPSGPVRGDTEHARTHPFEEIVEARGSHGQALSWARAVTRSWPRTEFELMYRDPYGTWRSMSGECPGQVAARRWDRGEP